MVLKGSVLLLCLLASSIAAHAFTHKAANIIDTMGSGRGILKQDEPDADPERRRLMGWKDEKDEPEPDREDPENSPEGTGRRLMGSPVEQDEPEPDREDPENSPDVPDRRLMTGEPGDADVDLDTDPERRRLMGWKDTKDTKDEPEPEPEDPENSPDAPGRRLMGSAANAQLPSLPVRDSVVVTKSRRAGLNFRAA